MSKSKVSTQPAVPADKLIARRGLVLTFYATLLLWTLLAAPMVGFPITKGMLAIIFVGAMLTLSVKRWPNWFAAGCAFLAATISTLMIPGASPGIPSSIWLQLAVGVLTVGAFIFGVISTVSLKHGVKDESLVWNNFVERAKDPATWPVAFLGAVAILVLIVLLLLLRLPLGPDAG